MADVRRAGRWLGLAGPLALAAVLVVGGWRWNRRVGKKRLDQEVAASRHQTGGPHIPPRLRGARLG
jgi:hypothetical protein